MTTKYNEIDKELETLSNQIESTKNIHELTNLLNEIEEIIHDYNRFNTDDYINSENYYSACDLPTFSKNEPKTGIEDIFSWDEKHFLFYNPDTSQNSDFENCWYLETRMKFYKRALS